MVCNVYVHNPPPPPPPPPQQSSTPMIGPQLPGEEGIPPVVEEEQTDAPPLPSPLSSSGVGETVDRKDTHKRVLMQLQSIFGHLLDGRLQFHVPKGFWRDFR